MFVVTDSFTAVAQDEIYRRFQVNNVVMMYYINMFVCVCLVPHVYWYADFGALYNNMHILISLTASSMFTQFFTLCIIQQFGAAVFAAVCLCKTVYTVFFATVILHGHVNYLEVVEVFVFTVLLAIAYHRPPCAATLAR